MSALVVDVVFRDRVLETVPFRAPVLRIGRMPDNEIVLDNLGVSRLHARLSLDAGRVFLEDAGSENGCLVNGTRVTDRQPIEPGDAIRIGKHELRVRRAVEGESIDASPARRRGDAWDGARTYVLDAPSSPQGPILAPAEPPPEPKEPVVMAPIVTQRSVPVSIPVDPGSSSDSHEIDFDFVGSLADSDEVESPATVPLASPTPAPAPAPPGAAAPMHAGFIVQRQGKLERVVAWTGDVLVAGRSADCDVQLPQDEVSRRHVRFERVEGRYEVVDLGSVNGTFVNGKRVERHALEIGDIVQVEGFQLTFVLDRTPLDGAIAAQPPSISQATRGDTFFAMTLLQEEMPEGQALAEVPAAPALAEEPTLATAAEIAETDLLPDDIEEIEASLDGDDDSKPIEAAPLRGSSRANSVQDLGRSSQPNLAAAELCLELRVRMDLLPPVLQRAFEEAGVTELVLPAELRLRK